MKFSTLFKKILRKVLNIILLPFLKYLLSERVGRDIIYSAFPNNSLIIGNTQEGLNFIINSSDNVIGRSIFKNKLSFDSHHLEQSLSIIGSRKNILLDVGANIGTIGILAVSSGLVSKCIAFEPEPNNFKMLEANVIINSVKDKFELHNVALSINKDGPLLFELSDNNFGDHRVRVGDNNGNFGEENRKVITVETNSLDIVCERINLDECILFMDTQGFEGHILSGGEKLLKAGVPIVTEFWPYGLLRANGLERFYSALSLANYTAIYDLKYANTKINFSIDSLKLIADNLGTDGCFTDLLFLKE